MVIFILLMILISIMSSYFMYSEIILMRYINRYKNVYSSDVLKNKNMVEVVLISYMCTSVAICCTCITCYISFFYLSWFSYTVSLINIINLHEAKISKNLSLP